MSLKKYSFFVLFYNIFVIFIGGVTRATSSGGGYGLTWPFSQSLLNPTASQMESAIDFAQQLISGLAFIFVLVLIVWVYKIYEKKSKIRSAARFILIFAIFQIIISAGLVLIKPGGENPHLIRASMITLHFINSFLLLGSNALMCDWVKDGEPKKSLINRNAKQLFAMLALLFLVLGASGTISSIGDKIFLDIPAMEGIRQNSSGENFLYQLKVYHPIIAVMVGMGIYFIYNNFLKKSINRKLNRYSKYLAGLFLLQLLLGVLNLILLSPIWLQLIHLLLAEIVWIIFILWINQIVFFGLTPSLPEKP